MPQLKLGNWYSLGDCGNLHLKSSGETVLHTFQACQQNMPVKSSTELISCHTTLSFDICVLSLVTSSCTRILRLS